MISLAKKWELVLCLLCISGCSLMLGTDAPEKKSPATHSYHIVRKDENLFRIAMYYYGTATTRETLDKVEKIRRANRLADVQISLGQKLIIPETAKKQPAYALVPPEAKPPEPKPVEPRPEGAPSPPVEPPPPTPIIKETVFVWPVQGKVICRFGELGNKGIDILVKPGTRVVASNEGIVSFVGSTAKYGETMVVQHPDGLYTVYGHDTSFQANKGKKVKKEEVLGEIKNGSQKQRYLHFEIRKGNETLDPLNYLPPLKDAGYQ